MSMLRSASLSGVILHIVQSASSLNLGTAAGPLLSCAFRSGDSDFTYLNLITHSHLFAEILLHLLLLCRSAPSTGCQSL